LANAAMSAAAAPMQHENERRDNAEFKIRIPFEIAVKRKRTVQ